MPKITNFTEAQAALRQFYGDHATVTYTLERIQALTGYLGNPQNSLKVVHVAGTSGKTSTSYYVAALLKAAGFKVGLTVSPHVDEVNERVQIDLAPLAEAEFCKALEEFIDQVNASGILPSYFELMVAFAYWEFARQKVDYAVVEVGLGGLLDGTNVITRQDKVCVITDIGLDHTAILGGTLDEIAAQKAGIIQPNNQVFVYEQTQDIMSVIEAAIAKQQATLQVLRPEVLPEASELPSFQQRNFGLAKAAVEYVLARDGHEALRQQQLQEAVTVHIPARMEILLHHDKTIIIDGAHNAQKLKTLLKAVQTKYPDQAVAALVGFVEGDTLRLEQSLDELMQATQTLIATSFYTEKDYPKRSFDSQKIVSYCVEHDFKNIQSTAEPAAALVMLLARPEPILLITGSFYLLNHIRPLLLSKHDSANSSN